MRREIGEVSLRALCLRQCRIDEFHIISGVHITFSVQVAVNHAVGMNVFERLQYPGAMASAPRVTAGFFENFAQQAAVAHSSPLKGDRSSPPKTRITLGGSIVRYAASR